MVFAPASWSPIRANRANGQITRFAIEDQRGALRRARICRNAPEGARAPEGAVLT
jgi:hypothetical protein